MCYTVSIERGEGMRQEERTVCFDRDLGIEAYRFRGIMQKFPNHFHEHYVIGFIESGKRHLLCRGGEYMVGPGDLLLFNPLDSHTCEQADENPLDYRCLNINSDVMRSAVLEVSKTDFLPKFARCVVYNSEHTIPLREVHTAIMAGETEFVKEESFLFLIERLLSECTKPPEKMKSETLSAETGAVCEYIESRFGEHITLEALSLVAGMNKFSLLRAFTREKGITPYRYLETVRINEAKKLLEHGMAPIDAAAQTGFSDQSHFTNFFKDFIGLTPGQYQSIFSDR